MIDNKYEFEEISNKNNLIKLELKIVEKNLEIKAFLVENFLTKTYIGNFSLEDLKKQNNYYIQFDDIKMVIDEIKGYYGDNKKEINEEEDKIIIKFPILSITYKCIEFTLNLKPKSDKEKIIEYEKVLNNLIKKFTISGFNSKIIKDKKNEEFIKMWISPFKDLSSKLIYSFYKEYNNNDFKKFDDIKNFHKNCDNKQNLLVLCKSKDEIFGGFSPLKYSSGYGCDNDSFVFSINESKKYIKKFQNSNYSIWNFDYYGPCFCYDLYFEKYTMNYITYDQDNYTIPTNFIKKKKCYYANNYIILDSLEIFEITFN